MLFENCAHPGNVYIRDKINLFKLYNRKKSRITWFKMPCHVNFICAGALGETALSCKEEDSLLTLVFKLIFFYFYLLSDVF